MEGKEKLIDESLEEDIIQNDNEYELHDICVNEDRIAQQPREKGQSSNKKQSSSWSPPFIVLTVLLCLILILLVAILCLNVVNMIGRDTATCTSSITADGSISSLNFTEWADTIASKVKNDVTQSLPNFNEWANDVINKVNINVTQSLPNFTEWANDVINEVNINVTQSLPNFNKWANDVINKVNTNVTQSLPNFTEWANDVINKVNTNVTQSLPNFNEWASDVINKVNTNVTQSLPNFNEWANDVINKVNTNVTQSLPNFNEWANDVINKVNTNVTQSLPNFTEWANGVAHNTFQLIQNYPNFTEPDEQILQTTRNSAQKLVNIVNTLSNLQDTSTSTAGVVDDILLIVEELLVLHNETAALPTSCQQLKQQQPSSPSGYYILAGTSGTYSAYCNMGTLCGSGVGWRRLAYLDMTDSTQSCPSGFRLYQSGGVRACGRPGTSASCVSVQFSSNGISYSQVCGRVVGYQYGHTDAVSDYHNNINSYYVEGVSITRGSPRQHVWTLMAGYTEANAGSRSCPCNTGSTVSVVPFIGNNYFCESGNTASGTSSRLYTSDPLWDGYNCRSYEAPCCTAPGLPWFHRDYGTSTTTDYIELRVCGDYSGEDSPVSFYEIYVK